MVVGRLVKRENSSLRFSSASQKRARLSSPMTRFETFELRTKIPKKLARTLNYANWSVYNADCRPGTQHGPDMKSGLSIKKRKKKRSMEQN